LLSRKACIKEPIPSHTMLADALDHEAEVTVPQLYVHDCEGRSRSLVSSLKNIFYEENKECTTERTIWSNNGNDLSCSCFYEVTDGAFDGHVFMSCFYHPAYSITGYKIEEIVGNSM
jgi:hypothetical protein